MNKVFFNTINTEKQEELRVIYSDKLDSIGFLEYQVTEILSHDLTKVILKKALDAYSKWHVPLIVEHGGLFIDDLNGFPGALSKPMWDMLGGEICNLLPASSSRHAKAGSAVCFCDGIRRIHHIVYVEGTISRCARGTNGFQWDPIFIPDGATQTFAEMDRSSKLRFSQAAKAHQELRLHIKF